MRIIAQIALWFVIIGGLNWGLIGLFDWNLVGFIFGMESWISRLIYALVGVGSVILIMDMFTPKSPTIQE